MQRISPALRAVLVGLSHAKLGGNRTPVDLDHVHPSTGTFRRGTWLSAASFACSGVIPRASSIIFLDFLEAMMFFFVC